MELIIVRHGDPDYELDSLTPSGVEEAKLLAKKLEKMDIAAFYCSPLGRAQKTASYTLEAMHREAETLLWLEEFRGRIQKPKEEKDICWDRLPSEWTENPQYYEKDWYKTDLMQTANTEEEYKIVCAGIDALLEKHGYKHERNHYKVLNSNHDKVVLFCHFGVESVILSHIFGISPMVLWHNTVALPSSVTTLVTEEREKGIVVFRMTAFGDTGHLYAGGREPSFAARFCECFEDDTRH